MMLGIFFGNMLFGILADKYGRKWPLTIGIIIQLGFGVLAAVSPWFWAFLICRILIGTATGGTMCTSFVLIMEFVGPKWRTIVAILYQVPFCLGHLSLGIIAYSFRDWRIMQMVISIPSICLLLYVFFIPESPRWLLMHNREDEAIAILENAAIWNHLPKTKIREDILKYTEEKQFSKRQAGNILSLILAPNLRTNFFCISCNWIACGLCYFGISQMISLYEEEVFLSITLSGAACIPGCIFAMWSMKSLGRKPTLLLSSVIAFIPCFISAFTVFQHNWLKVFVNMISLFGLMLQHSCIHIYTGELFPTVIRNVAIGLSLMLLGIGAMVSPFLLLLPQSNFSSPLTFGIIQVLAGLLALFLPETLDCKLSDTLEEAEIQLKKRDEEQWRELVEAQQSIIRTTNISESKLKKVDQSSSKHYKNLDSKTKLQHNSLKTVFDAGSNKEQPLSRRVSLLEGFAKSDKSLETLQMDRQMLSKRMSLRDADPTKRNAKLKRLMSSYEDGSFNKKKARKSMMIAEEEPKRTEERRLSDQLKKVDEHLKLEEMRKSETIKQIELLKKKEELKSRNEFFKSSETLLHKPEESESIKKFTPDLPTVPEDDVNKKND